MKQKIQEAIWGKFLPVFGAFCSGIFRYFGWMIFGCLIRSFKLGDSDVDNLIRARVIRTIFLFNMLGSQVPRKICFTSS